MATTEGVASNPALDILKQDKNPALTQLKRTDENIKSAADRSKASLADDFDTFLLMLTTQLQNQDPTAPLDANQFTQQLVAFTGVEQAIATNTNLEKLVSLASGSQIDNAVGYIGKSVEAEGNKGMLPTGGLAEFTYELPVQAQSVTVTISDSFGQPVFTGQGSTKAGRNVVIWDGTNSFNGKDMPEGEYNISIKALGQDDSEIKATTLTSGRVTAVDIDEKGKLMLNIGSIKLELDKVRAVREVPNVGSS